MTQTLLDNFNEIYTLFVCFFSYFSKFLINLIQKKKKSNSCCCNNKILLSGNSKYFM